jgi:predicted helicase
MSIGTKEAKAIKGLNAHVIFKLFSNGNDSGRDSWVYNFDQTKLLKNAQFFAETYNAEVARWLREGKPRNIDDFVSNDEKRIKWTRNAKRDLRQGRYIEFTPEKVRTSIYRPFTIQYFYPGKIFNKEVALFPRILPTLDTENENCVICVSGIGSNKPFHSSMVSQIPCLDMLEKTQCFPFYTYNEDGSNRRENITDWSLAQFHTHYQNDSISKWDIFHYVYAVLHHPDYRERYQANLKRELPRIPFAPDFTTFAKVGERLSEIHIGYEDQHEYPLKLVENPNKRLDWCVEKMKLSKDKTQIIYNDFLTLDGIPSEAFEYRLGNRSALDWVIDQYRVKTDKRSGIKNDPNRLDDPQYIVRLIKQVITVSLSTVTIVKALPDLGIPLAD